MTAPGGPRLARCRSRSANVRELGDGGWGLVSRREGGLGRSVGRYDSSISRSRSREDQRRPSFLVYQSGVWEGQLDQGNGSESEDDFEREKENLLCGNGQENSQENRQVGKPGGQEETKDNSQCRGGNASPSYDLKLHLSRLSSKMSEAVANNDLPQLQSALSEKRALEQFIGGRINEQLNLALMEAVTQQSGRMVGLLLSAGADPGKFSQPLLITAVDFNAPSVVYALIDNGFGVNAKGSHGTALHSAMRVGSLELADCLYKAGADLNAVDESKTTPLHLAVQTKNFECVQWLLSKGCAVDPVDSTWGRTPLHWASMFNSTEILSLLLDNGADLMAMDKNGCAPWTLSVTNTNLDALCVLFFDEIVNVKDIKGKSPLHWACRSGFTAGMEFLLNKGSNINSKDNEGITPLMDALAMRQHKVATHILKHYELDLNIKDLKGKTSLHWATRTGNITCTKLLLEKGADCNLNDFSNISPFQEAVTIRHSATAEAIVKWEHFDRNQKDWKGETPLHWAAQTGLVSSVRYLLKFEDCANVQTRYGRTPLMDAVTNGEVQVVSVLLQNPQIKVNQTDFSGQTALHLLLTEESSYLSMSMLERLVKGGADLNMSMTASHCSPLITYIKFWPQIGQALLNVGADPNVITEGGNTALLQAVESGDIETVKMVLRVNIDLEITSVKGPNGLTPLLEACNDEDTNIYKLLVNVGCSMIGVPEFIDEVADTRSNPKIDKELSWLEKRLQNPITLFESSRLVVNKVLGYKNYRKKLDCLGLPKRLKELLTVDGFIEWKERNDRIQYND